MIINISKVDEEIIFSSKENKSVQFKFNADGSNLNNNSLLTFLVNLSSQDEEFTFEKQTQSEEVDFLCELFLEFSKTMKEQRDEISI